MPGATRENLACWVDYNIDALVRAFVIDDDAVVVVADEGNMVDEECIPNGFPLQLSIKTALYGIASEQRLGGAE